MKSIQTKESIGSLLYVIASGLLLVNIFQLSSGKQSTLIGIVAAVAFIVAVFYGMWLRKEKKKTGDQ